MNSFVLSPKALHVTHQEVKLLPRQRTSTLLLWSSSSSSTCSASSEKLNVVATISHQDNQRPQILFGVDKDEDEEEKGRFFRLRPHSVATLPQRRRSRRNQQRQGRRLWTTIVPTTTRRMRQLLSLSLKPPTATTSSTTASIGIPKSNKNTTELILCGGIFGLGGPELIVIIIATLLVLGPDRLGSIFRSSGTRTREFQEDMKKIPDEFMKGLEQGEIEARARTAKPMRRVVVAEKDDRNDDSTS